MNAIPSQLLLFATNIGRAFQKHTDRGSSNSSNLVLILIAIVAVVSAVVAAMYFLERKRALDTVKVDSEQLLFRELCRIHGLSIDQTTLLQTLAKTLGAQQCDIFVDPAILDSAIAGGHAAKYEPLKRKLFGGDGGGQHKPEAQAKP